MERANNPKLKNLLRQLTALFLGFISAVLITGAGINNSVAAQDTVPEYPPAEIQAEPIISIWYGENQIFGVPGMPQRQVNILGNVKNTTSLYYQLNGGQIKPLTIGSDSRRLYNPGDFAIDLMDMELLNGNNSVVITATGSSTVVREVNFTYLRNQFWPENIYVNWNSGSLQTLAQVVDGKWELTQEGIRTAEVGYDRLIAIGDMGWRDYEVVVPITMHSKDDNGFDDPSYGPAVGILLRWTGHTDRPVVCAQPKCGWQPFGTIAWYRWLDPNQPDRGQLYLYMNSALSQYAPPSKQLSFGVPYFFKARVETLANGQSIYKFKVWQQNENEPFSWDVSATDRANEYATGDPVAGSLLLLAHHVDVTFGDVSVTQLGLPPTSMGTSDDFNACQISMEIWDWIDPNGTSSTTVSSPYGGDAGAAITIPSGEIQSVNPPINNLPRLMQTIGDGNFLLEVKFDTPLSGSATNYEPAQGILLESVDGNRWLRVELYSQGNGTNLRVYTHERISPSSWINTKWVDENITTDGISPIRLKLQRSGSRFLISFKIQDNLWIDRLNLPLHLVLDKAGVYAGNFSNTPSPSNHTFLVDYVQFNQQPLIRSDDVKNSLVVNLSGQGAVIIQPEQNNYTCGQQVQLTADPDERWIFNGWSGDHSGDEPVSEVLMDKPKSIIASFIQTEFVVEVSTSGMGEVYLKPNKTTYSYGENVSIEAVPHSGWFFDRWDGTVVGTDNPLLLSIENDFNLVAIFDTPNRVFLPFVIR